MSQRRWDEAHYARTLIQAHEALVGLRPKSDAPVPEWIAFHQHSSAVYRTLAEVDEGHRLEALYWATREKARADELGILPAGSPSRQRRTRSTGDTGPKTLQQAHDALRAVRPALVAAPTLWREYHRHAAAIYAEVSEVDRGHHHEAVAWASRERVLAEVMSGRIGDGPVSGRWEAGPDSPNQVNSE